MRRRWFLAGAAGLAAAVPAPVRVRLETPLGPIVIAPDLARAPLSAGAFLACVDAGGYDGGAFTRVVDPANDHGTPPISVLQGAARRGRAFARIAHEPTRLTGLRHQDGTVSLTRDAPGTASGGEFFICIGPEPALDYGGARNRDGQGFAAFGQVVAGMDTVRALWRTRPSATASDPYLRGQLLDPPIPILAARRL